MQIEHKDSNAADTNRLRPTLVSVSLVDGRLHAEGRAGERFIEENNTRDSTDNVARHVVNRWIEKAARLLALDGQWFTHATVTAVEMVETGKVKGFAVEFGTQPRERSVEVVIGATEPSGATLDWLDDTACLSFAQGARRRDYIAEQLRPHEDSPRYYFVRKLRLPQDESGNGEPR